MTEKREKEIITKSLILYIFFRIQSVKQSCYLNLMLLMLDHFIVA